MHLGLGFIQHQSQLQLCEGPDHGRMERQVELSWRIERMTPDQLPQFLNKITEISQPLWNESGVGVC